MHTSNLYNGPSQSKNQIGSAGQDAATDFQGVKADVT